MSFNNSPQWEGDTSHLYKLRLHLAYEGTAYKGWQRQKQGIPTIQGTLEAAFSRLFNESIQIIGAGRTDAGVHALGQVAHLVTTKNPQKFKLLRAINGILPPTLSVHQVYLAPHEFHARKSAAAKTYHYWVLNRSLPSPFRRNHITWISRPLSLDFLNECSQFIQGTHDFSSFCTAGTHTLTRIRTVHKATWKHKKGTQLFCFSITGNGFLKQMVRNIVGTMLDLYFSGASPQKMNVILRALDRRAALGTAQPEGLYLYRIYYPQHLDNKCRTL